MFDQLSEKESIPHIVSMLRKKAFLWVDSMICMPRRSSCQSRDRLYTFAARGCDLTWPSTARSSDLGCVTSRCDAPDSLAPDLPVAEGFPLWCWSVRVWCPLLSACLHMSAWHGMSVTLESRCKRVLLRFYRGYAFVLPVFTLLCLWSCLYVYLYRYIWIYIHLDSLSLSLYICTHIFVLRNSYALIQRY